MDNDAMPSNAKMAKNVHNAITPKVKKIVTGDVVTRKPPLGRRLRDTFISGEAGGVGSYIIFEVIIPATKDIISDVIQQGLERMLYGERQSGRRGGYRQGGNQNVSYHNRYSSSTPWSRGRQEESRPVSRRARASHDFDEIILQSRIEADDVISHLFELVKEYGHATVNDLYEMTGITGSFADEKYGWTDLRGVGAVRVSGGYLLDLPKPELLD